MKKTTSTLGLFFICHFISAQNIVFPKYKDVVSTFFNTYQNPSENGSYKLAFEKKTDGYHVALYDYDQNSKKIKDQLYWATLNKKYNVVNFKEETKKANKVANITAVMNEYGANYYDICPYYGYAGWDADVIKNYNYTENHTDSTIYGIGRAYASYSQNLLNNNSGFAKNSSKFKITAGPNALNTEQLKTYLDNKNKAIACYEKLNTQNPNFPTIVGLANIKLANEYMSGYLEMIVYQNETVAEPFLKPNIYPVFLENYAKNILNSLPRNAIFFAYGDNDTYPLLYIQKKYGIRTDVSVINSSLVGTYSYIKYLKQEKTPNRAIPISLSDSTVAEGVNDYIFVESTELEDYQPVTKMIAKINNGKNVKTESYGKYGFFPSAYMYILQETDSIFLFKNNNYMYKNELLILDIINENNNKRPIYFSLGQEYADANLFLYCLESEGLALKLTKNLYSENETLLHKENAISYQNLITNYNYEGINDIRLVDKIISYNYRTLFVNTAYDFVNEGANDSAKALLNKCFELFPNKSLYYDPFLTTAIELYYKLEEPIKANEIAITLAYNIKYDVYNEIDEPASESNKKAVLGEIKRLAKLYKQETVLKTIDKQ